MTKSTKRKKERSADFTKKRLKLGKGKQVASNAVDTSFKARSISLPQQTIAIDKAVDAPTTKRKLTLEDLIMHLRHYSPGIRRDALHGLHELLDEHEFLIGPNLAKLVNACARLMTDEDAAVRKALHSFLDWLMPRVPNEILRPYASTLLLFTASALSHIFPEIRIDAIRLLDLFLESIPEEVVSGLSSLGSGSNNGKSGTGHGKKILDGYLSLLNIGTKFSENEGNAAAGPSSGHALTLVTLSSASKALVLCSFASFLRHAVASIEDKLEDEESMPTWFMSSTFSSPSSFKAFQTCLRGIRCKSKKSPLRMQDERAWSMDRTHFYGSFPLIDISNEQTLGALNMSAILADLSALSHGTTSEDSPETASLHLISSLSRTMHPVLISTFLDCAPSVFSPTQSAPEDEMRSVQALMRISQSLYGYLLRNDAESDQLKHARLDLRPLVAHMSIYFPFGEDTMLSQDMKALSMFQELNVIYCELFSLQASDPVDHPMSHASEASPAAGKQRNADNRSKFKASRSFFSSQLSQQSAAVEDYVTRCLRGSPMESMPASQPLTAQSYRDLLPTLWWLLGRESALSGLKNDDNPEILMSVLQHAIKVAATSGVKRIATEFVGRLILLQQEPAYRGHVRLEVKSRPWSGDVEIALRSWLLHLPKALWSIGDKDPETSELVLRLLLRIIQRRPWLIDTESLSGISSRIAPYFTMQHATRGEMKGPFASLSRPLKNGPLASTDDHKARQYTALRRLALDVAAVLVATSASEAQSARQRVRNTQKKSKEGDDEAQTAAETLRQAAAKAVGGSNDEAYWRGVSSLSNI